MSPTGYFKIRINSILPNKPTTFDLFVLINNHFVLYLREGHRLEEKKIKTFEQSNADVFFVKDDQRQSYKNYVQDCLTSGQLQNNEKALILKETTFSLVEELFESPNVQAAMNESRETINQIIDFMQAEEDALTQMIGLSSHDFYTYNHSLDVSIYSIGLAQAIGYNDPEDLKQIGMGGLLHDIGKRHVPTTIICKRGPLDDTEWDEMKKHPAYGLKIVTDNPDIGEHTKACIFEHHEDFQGGGYPMGLVGEEIHPMARIVCVCDCYDALTTKRSYSNPMTPTSALDLMKVKLLKKFDPAFLKAMQEVLMRMKLD